jgi:hypothetical protein
MTKARKTKSRPFSSTPSHRKKKEKKGNKKEKRIRETIGGFVLVVPANVGGWMDIG